MNNILLVTFDIMQRLLQGTYYIIGTSSVARAWSGNLDSLTGNKISHAMNESLPIRVDFLAEYPDFLAVGLIAIVTSRLLARFLRDIKHCEHYLHFYPPVTRKRQRRYA